MRTAKSAVPPHAACLGRTSWNDDSNDEDQSTVSAYVALESTEETQQVVAPVKPKLDVALVFQQLRNRLHRLLRRRGRTHDETEDLVQEAFVRLQLFLNDGREVMSPEAFLVRTVLNLSVDARRRDRRDLYVDEPAEELNLADINPAPEELLAADERLRKMQNTLDTALNPRTRQIYLLHRLEGFTYQEIATRMSMPVRTVEKHIARAVTVLCLEREKERLAVGFS